MTQNRLANSASPYLLQHADNPVDWYPWGEEALERAKKEDKPIIVSIGYSSCHWCHVMAHESFEDDSVAQIMNDNFINIKIDREERPDIDQVYMEAVQAMGLNGGWPLNVFLTPDQKPFYGGTYFPRDGWIRLLGSVTDTFGKNREKLEESAQKITDALNVDAAQQYYMSPESKVTLDNLRQGYQKLAGNFDLEFGGVRKEANKFPIPTLWQYQLNLHYLTMNDDIMKHLLFTLERIANGGIYDQIGGGFARYSVDTEWHVPHFEKMLYDNGQLLSLYSQAYKLSPNPKFKEVVFESIEWLQREMLDSTSGFYAALDADSEGEEGKFYVWSMKDVVNLSGSDSSMICEYYDVKLEGNWEATNVLRVVRTKDEMLGKYGISSEAFDQRIKAFKKTALLERAKREKPGLDNKIISGWNGMVLTGILDAYQTFGDSSFLMLAKDNYTFLTTQMIKDGKLEHVYQQGVQGFAEDYAAVIQALIKYYETTFENEALTFAEQLTKQMLTQFLDKADNMFFYTALDAEGLIARKKVVLDNVIPSSNSVMAENLIKLGTHLDKNNYKTLAQSMIDQVSEMIIEETGFMAQWASAATLLMKPFPEIAIVGENAMEVAADFNKLNIPLKTISASVQESDLPLLEYKSQIGDGATIYVCFNKACKLPVNDIESAIKLIPR
ncbi:MAG: thioredoxin domain-containing protein [Cyclobacteriaceae bacterium]